MTGVNHLKNCNREKMMQYFSMTSYMPGKKNGEIKIQASNDFYASFASSSCSIRSDPKIIFSSTCATYLICCERSRSSYR